MPYGLLFMQDNGKKKRVNWKSGCIIEYIPERKQKVLWDDDRSQTEEYGKSLKFIKGPPSSQVCIPALAWVPSSVSVMDSVPVPVEVSPSQLEDSNAVEEKVEYHDLDKWTAFNGTGSDFDFMSKDDDENLKSDLDVRGCGVKYTPVMVKEFKNADQTN